MPIDTDLSKSPYFDDFSLDKKYYNILFKPGFPVQTRELNQMMSILQAQIEKFGDNILRRGTVIDGCNFAFYPNYPYAKINDSQIDGQPVDVDLYKNLYAKNNANLVATIINTESGFQSQDPNLNTLYLKYINGGNTGNVFTFSSNDILTIYDSNNSVRQINVNNGGSGFSNNDQVVLLSAIAVAVSSSNTFQVGETITQANTNARAVIVATNNTLYTNRLVLSIKPVITDVANTSANSAKWTFNNGFNVVGGTTGAVANVALSIGTGAAGSIVTDALGATQAIAMSSLGYGYTIAPYATIKPSSNAANLNDLSLTAQNYLCQVTVSNLSDSIGVGYAFGVSKGTIYQKGRFLEVDPQIVIVSKYNSVPDQLSIGFDTIESIVNSNFDSSLLDNVSGTPSEFSPGADRLKLEPNLVVLDSSVADANSTFFSLVNFSNGLAFQQNQATAFNSINTELALRTYEEAGDFVTDPFEVAVSSPANNSLESNTIALVVAPGTAYISGNRVTTLTNSILNVSKGLDTGTASENVDINFGNYLRINELAGIFQFDTGDYVSLRDTAAHFVSNTTNIGTTIAGVGNEIGQARMRSLTYDSGQPGTPGGTYDLYLFDVKMNAGKNLRDVGSVFYTNGTRLGIADVVKTFNATLQANVAALQASSNNSLLFDLGVASAKSANAVTFAYRRIANTSANTQGLITVSLVPTEETFPYSQLISNTEVTDLIAIPLANAVSNVATTATATCNNTSNLINGTNLLTLSAGDYVTISQGANVNIRMITAVANSTRAQIDQPATFTSAGANLFVTFPQNIPVVLSNRTGRSANTDVTKKTLTINLGTTLASNTTFNLIHNIQSTASQATKTVNRKQFVKLDMATHPSSNTGPWTLGVSDAFRLRGVWIDANIASVTVSSPNVLNEFYIDHNQNPNFYDQSYLYLKPTSKLALANTAGLLVQFDAFTIAANSYQTISSYNVVDNYDIDSSPNTINTEEIPEVFSDTGEYYDLRNQIDFRPKVANTAVLTANAALATVNPSAPSYSTKFGNTSFAGNLFKFPPPSSNVKATVTRYIGHTTRVVIDTRGKITAIDGQPADINPTTPSAPANTLTIGVFSIPPYPSIPLQKSSNVISTYDKSIANEKFTYKREQDHTVGLVVDSSNNVIGKQTLGFTMEDIAKLERRIENLESQAALTARETAIGNLNIPSSNDPQINRFKFGFFVDDFTTTNYSDKQNPEYAAAFSNNYITPVQKITNLVYRFNELDPTTANDTVGSILTYPFTATTLISQTSATDGPVSIVIPPPPPPPPPPPVYPPPPVEPPTPPTPISVPVVIPPATPAPTPVATVVQYAGSISTAQEYAVDMVTSWDNGAPLFLNNVGPSSYKLTYQQIIYITCTGLKPYTTHKMVLNGVDISGSCFMQAGFAGSPLNTDGSGRLSFYFLLNRADGSSGLTSYAVNQQMISQSGTGSKDMVVTTADGSSVAKMPLGYMVYLPQATELNNYTYGG